MIDRTEAIDVLASEGLFVTEWSDDADAFYPSHVHEQREVRIVLEGTMTIRTPTAVHELGPGDRVDLAAGEQHEARVGPRGVRYLAGSAR